MQSSLQTRLIKFLVPANGRNRFIARFSYSPQQPDELTLNEGDELEFIENVEDGWARGMLHTSGPFKGKTGTFAL